MRLIDADAAIDAIKSVFSPTPTQKDIKWDCVRVVENLPTIQPQTARWIEPPEEATILFGGHLYIPPMKCSNCGRTALNEPWTFCPNCGAKMEKRD